MKRILLYLLILLGAGVVSCTNEDYLVYDRDAKNRISFGRDSIGFVYGFKEDTETDMTLTIALMGFVQKEKPADVKIEVESENVELGKHITMSAPVFGIDSTVVPLKFDIARMALTRGTEYRMIIRLLPNEEFEPTGIKECIVTFGDLPFEQPKWWDAKVLGKHTQEKHVKFVELFTDAEEKDPLIYGRIRSIYGQHLDGSFIGPDEVDRTYAMLWVKQYKDFFWMYILWPMYEYYLETGDPAYETPDPWDFY